METFKIEVQEFLARVIEIEAMSSSDAIAKVDELYKKVRLL